MKTLTSITYPVFALFAFACFALLPTTRAVSPPPDGGYPGFNTAEGQSALFSLTTGTGNSAVGAFSLFSNTESNFNTAVGIATLALNVGTQNTAIGAFALLSNTTGQSNTASGVNALLRDTDGSFNTANGFTALQSNTLGGANTAIGGNALQSNSTGNWNTANGASALVKNTTGSRNIGVGFVAGCALSSGDDNIIIGNSGVDTESNTIRIGTVGTEMSCSGLQLPVHTATYIAGISGQDATGGDPVFITAAGKLGTVNPPSSARFKEEIKPMNKASEAILALKPVTFRYKKEFDPTRIPQFGLVAEEVEKVNPDLVKRDREGKVQTVRYEAVNAMLLNEFLKEHRKVQELEANAARQEMNIAQQQKQIEALTAGLQKVSAQLELSKAAPQSVLKNQ